MSELRKLATDFNRLQRRYSALVSMVQDLGEAVMSIQQAIIELDKARNPPQIPKVPKKAKKEK